MVKYKISNLSSRVRFSYATPNKKNKMNYKLIITADCNDGDYI